MQPDSSFPNRIQERREVKTVIKHLVRRTSLMGAVGQQILDSDYLDQDFDLKILLQVVCHYWAEFSSLPSYDVLCAEIEDHSLVAEQRKAGSGLPPEFIARYRTELIGWYQDQQWSDEWAKQILQDFLKRYAAQQLIEKLSSVDDLDVIEQAYNSVDNIIRGDPFGELVESTVWDDIWGHMYEAERMSTGCEFVDQALAGGLAEKDCMLFIAPSGGGKTTMGMQMASYRVLHESHIVYVATEQPNEGDMATRQAMLGAGATRTQMEKGRGGASPELLARVEAVTPYWREYFHFIDCRKSQKSNFRIEDIFVPVDRLIEAGKKPELIVLDWWGRLRVRMMMAMSAKADSTRSRIAASEWLDTLIDGTKERKSRLCVLHQTKGASAGKGPKARVSTHDAQEDSNLNNLFEFAFALGKLDSDNRCRVNCDKARTTARTDGYLYLDGERGRFSTADATTMDFTAIPKGPINKTDVAIDSELTQGQH
jgi:hypothetical protein